MGDSYHFDELQHFTAGTVGPRGQRTFYLQFGNHGDLVSLKMEKGQVSALAEFLDQLLDDVEPVPEDEVPLALDLIDPVEAAWAVASIGVAFQEDDRSFVLVAEELVLEDDDDVVPDPASAQLRVTPGQVRAFVERARDLVAAGRPPCDFCGRALDYDDGWCPCHN